MARIGLPIPGRGASVILVGVLLSVGAPLRSQEPVPPRIDAGQWPAELEVRFDVRYDDSPSSLRRLTILARALPPTRLHLLEPQGIGDVIRRRYGLNREVLPKTYELFQREVLRLNRLQEPGRLRPGPLLVPSLPPLAEEPEREIPGPVTPQIYRAPMRADTILVPGEVPRTRRVLESDWRADPRGRAAPRALLRFTGSSAEIGELLRAHPDIWESVRQPTGAMEIRYAAGLCGDGDPGHQVLSGEERAALERALSEGDREARLFILDSGWPPERAAASKAALAALFDGLRAAVNDSLARWDLELSAPRLDVDSRPEGPANAHAVGVAAALEEFESLPGAGTKVPVIFVPLSRDQGAGPFLRELLMLHLVWTAVQGQRFDPEELELIRTRVNRELEWIPEDAEVDAQGLLASSKAIVDAVFTLGQWAAADGGGSFFLNASWTLVGPRVKPEWPSVPRGILVTAVGNDRGVNVNEAGVDFARLGSTRLTVAPVMNAGPEGLQCNSSSVRPATGLAVGYDGQTARGCCTSYAAPRAAWILAADAVRGIDPVFSWASRLAGRLDTARAQNEGLLLDPVVFLRSAQ